MWKTFFVSPVVGGVGAILGWVAAILIRDSMTDAAFADLRFGWSGLMIGGIAVAVLVLLLLASDMVDTLVTVAASVVGAALLWDYTELPFSTTNFERGTDSNYWFAVTMMGIVFILLLLGLRGARETNRRARG